MLGVTAAVAVLAVRGADGHDDLGVYDDRLYGVTPTAIKVWDCNTNPSRRKPSVAELVPGIWRMVPGIHGITTGRPRPAFRQAPDATFTVRRWQREGLFRGFFAINLHDGGVNSTSSLGCITLRPAAFKELLNYLYAALGWTTAKSRKDPEGNDAPRFPVVLQTADQIRELLAKEDDVVAPPATTFTNPGTRPITIKLPGAATFTGGLLVAGQAMVPVREFLAVLLKVKPEEAPIVVKDDGDDEDSLLDVSVNGHPLTEVSEELLPKKGFPPRLWCWVPELIAACGFAIADWDNETKTLTISKPAPKTS